MCKPYKDERASKEPPASVAKRLQDDIRDLDTEPPFHNREIELTYREAATMCQFDKDQEFMNPCGGNTEECHLCSRLTCQEHRERRNDVWVCTSCYDAASSGDFDYGD